MIKSNAQRPLKGMYCPVCKNFTCPVRDKHNRQYIEALEKTQKRRWIHFVDSVASFLLAVIVVTLMHKYGDGSVVIALLLLTVGGVLAGTFSYLLTKGSD